MVERGAGLELAAGRDDAEGGGVRPAQGVGQRVARVRIRRRDGAADVLARCRVLGDAPRGCIPNDPPCLQKRTCVSNERIGGMCCAFQKTPRERWVASTGLRLGNRRVKGRLRPMLGFKTFYDARRVIVGIELAQKIHKRQFAISITLRSNPAVIWRHVMAA